MKRYKKWCVISLFVSTAAFGQKKAKPVYPEFSTSWVDGNEQSKTYHLRASYLKEEPIFQSFDKYHFDTHLLPKGELSFRNEPKKKINSAVLSQLAQTAVEELREGKKHLTHFKILKRREFSLKRKVGTIILKYKDYPFVLKLFIESPRSFATPTDKNFKHGIMAKMTGGLSRYLSGFSRIKNLEYTKNFMATNSDVPVKLDFPRKWFWLPEKARWFEVSGKNFGTATPTIKLPEMYAIVADEIVGIKESAKLNKYQKRIYALCQKMDYQIDPNMLNFKIERATNKLVIIDTECFRKVIGIKEPIYAASHQRLRYQLVSKGIHDILFA
jgi:hypothetical protein